MATAIALETRPTVGRTPGLQPYRFTVKQYHHMIEAGVLTANDRVELLDGWVVEKMPHNPPHDGTVGRINRRLLRVLPDDWLLRVRCAITLRGSEPEPDLAIVRGPEETYFERHPGPQDITLLIEVADSSLLDDRRNKGPITPARKIVIHKPEAPAKDPSLALQACEVPSCRRNNYARAHIAVYWIVNIRDSRVEVYTQPVAGKSPRYRQQEDYSREMSIPLILEGKELTRLPVRDLLPPSGTK